MKLSVGPADPPANPLLACIEVEVNQSLCALKSFRHFCLRNQENLQRGLQLDNQACNLCPSKLDRFPSLVHEKQSTLGPFGS